MIYFIIGAMIGSFMLCLTYEEKSLMRNSHCDYCKHFLHWFDLIPIISFILLRGRCRYCGVQLSHKYFISEVLSGLALVLIHFYPVLDITLLSTIALILIPLAIYDTEHLMIPNDILFLLLLLLMIIRINYLFNERTFDSSTIFYKFLIVLLLHLFFFLTKSIGYGDIKLFTILLIFLPLSFFIALFFMTYVIGGMASIIFLSYKTALKRMPLVPFIASAFFVVLILYEEIKKLYFGGFVQ